MRLLFVSILFFSYSLQAEYLPSNIDLNRLSQQKNFLLTSQEIHQANLKHLNDFITFDVDTSRDDIYYNKPDYLDPRVAKDIYNLSQIHPVVSLWQYNKYDPYEKGIGFCFGRAMFVHLELVQRGMDRDAIKKIFAIGPMTTSGDNSSAEWGWHVATAVQSLDRKGKEIWLVIDPILNRIVNIYEWYEELKRDFSTDGKLRVWMTAAGKFGTSSGQYSHDSIEDDFYNDYFNDLMDWFDKESKKGRYDRPVTDYRL